MQSEVTTNKSQDPYLRLLKYIVATIVVAILICGFVIGLPYLPYLSANIAIVLAKSRATPLYEQLVAIAPASVQIVEKSDVQSGMYAFGLSDGADQYAHVWAKLRLRSSAPAADVISAHSILWSKSGLTPISSGKPDAIDSLFRASDDENLLVGICRSGASNVVPATMIYTVFIDYANGQRCDNPAGGNKEVLEKLRAMEVKEQETNSNQLWKGLEQFKVKKKTIKPRGNRTFA